MVNRLTIVLEQPEYSALLNLARDEMRNAPDQARWMIYQHLAERGMLPTGDQAHKPTQPQPAAEASK